MAIFNSYVKLPEGSIWINLGWIVSWSALCHTGAAKPIQLKNRLVVCWVIQDQPEAAMSQNPVRKARRGRRGKKAAWWKYAWQKAWQVVRSRGDLSRVCTQSWSHVSPEVYNWWTSVSLIICLIVYDSLCPAVVQTFQAVWHWKMLSERS